MATFNNLAIWEVIWTSIIGDRRCTISTWVSWEVLPVGGTGNVMRKPSQELQIDIRDPTAPYFRH